MSKRAPGQPRRARDFYPTPPEAVLPLVPHLPRRGATYVEPCAGAGDLIRGLELHWPQGRCIGASDLEPQAPGIAVGDARSITESAAHLFITNPPWPRMGSRGEPVISLARHLASLRPTWLLLPFDFAAAGYFAALGPLCARIVPVGRVSWMGNGVGGKDNAAWFLFDTGHVGATAFHPRLSTPEAAPGLAVAA